MKQGIFNFNAYFLVMQRIPLIAWLTISYMSGMLWSTYTYLITIPLLSAELIYQTYAIPRLYAASGFLAFFFLGGFVIIQKEKTYLFYEQLLTSKLMSVEGIITNAIQNERGTQITLCIQSCREAPEAKNAYVRLDISEQGEAIIGDTVRTVAIFLRSPENSAMKQLLHKAGIVATARIKSFSQITLLPTASWWQKRQHAIKMKLIQAIQQDLSPGAAALFMTLFLGYPLPHATFAETRSLFERWGISHYLARSGLHMVIILSLLHSLFMCIPLRMTIKNSCIMLFSIFYALLSWPTVSFMRALLTTIWYTCCMQKSIAIHALHILSLVTMMLLVYQPLFLFSIDFQLSFGLTFILLFISLSNTATQSAQFQND